MKGRAPVPYGQATTDQHRAKRQISVYFYPAEFEVIRQAAAAQDISMCEWIRRACRAGSPALDEASSVSSRSIAVRLARAEQELQKARERNVELERAAQPEVRIGQRGTSGDLQFSVPEYLLAAWVRWGTEYLRLLDHEQDRAARRKDWTHQREIAHEMGVEASCLDAAEQMRAKYVARAPRRPTG